MIDKLPIDIPSALRFFICIVFMLWLTDGNAQNDAGIKSSPRVLAFQYLQQNKMAEAEAAFLKAIQVTPKDISNYSDLSLLYLKELRYNDAEAQAMAGMRLNKNSSLIRSILAKINVQKGNKPTAINELKTILQREPKNIYANYTLANLNSTASVNDKKKSLSKVLSFTPDNIIIRLQLTALFLQSGKADSALFFLQSVKKIAPDFSTPAADFYNRTAIAIHANKLSNALIYLGQFQDLMKTTVIYARGLSALELPSLPDGYTEFNTSQITNKNQSGKKPSLSDIHFTEIC